MRQKGDLFEEEGKTKNFSKLQKGGLRMNNFRKKGKKTLLQKCVLGVVGFIIASSLCTVQFAFAAKELSGKITVLTLPAGSIFGEPFVRLLPVFEKEYPGIRVNHITFGYDEAIKKYFAAFAAKSSAYDVVQIDFIYSKGFTKAGHLEPLDDYIGKAWLDDFTKDCPKSVYGLYTYKGKFYGLPTIGNCQVFCYNRIMLGEEGLGRPDTWDELIEAARKLTKPEKNQYGFVASFERLVKGASLWFHLFTANGGKAFDEEMVPHVNSKPGVDALKTLLELIKYGPPGVSSYTEMDEIRAISTGLAAMDPFVWIPDPVTRPPDPEVGKQLWMGLCPKGKVRRAPLMGGLGLVVPAYSRNKKAAAEYVKWFNSKNVQMNLIIQNGGQPCRTSAWNWNLYLDKQGYLKSRMENIPVAAIRPQIPEYPEFDGIIGLQMSRALIGELTPEKAMDIAQEKIFKMMKEAGYYK